MPRMTVPTDGPSEVCTTTASPGAGGASGGDILFHEVCAELSVPTTLWLALPPDRYVMESVAPAGPDWVPRFHLVQASASSVRLFAPPNDSSPPRPYGSIFEVAGMSSGSHFWVTLRGTYHVTKCVASGPKLSAKGAKK